MHMRNFFWMNDLASSPRGLLRRASSITIFSIFFIFPAFAEDKPLEMQKQVIGAIGSSYVDLPSRTILGPPDRNAIFLERGFYSLVDYNVFSCEINEDNGIRTLQLLGIKYRDGELTSCKVIFKIKRDRMEVLLLDPGFSVKKDPRLARFWPRVMEIPIVAHYLAISEPDKYKRHSNLLDKPTNPLNPNPIWDHSRPLIQIDLARIHISGFKNIFSVTDVGFLQNPNNRFAFQMEAEVAQGSSVERYDVKFTATGEIVTVAE